MFPKILHYIWFGSNPLTPLAEQCLASWKHYMPNWQFMRWDETNFDIAAAPLYVRQAYEVRKFAFVSDYVRLWVLGQYGGVYVDTDVKVLRSYEPLLNNTAYIGFEESKVHLPGTCVMGCEPHCQWVKDMLALYENISFIKPNGSLDMTTNVERMGTVMMKELMHERISELGSERVRDRKYWKQNKHIEKWGLRIYTHDYFSPITSTRVIRKTKNTYSIHYFAESWRDWTIIREIVNALVQVKRITNEDDQIMIVVEMRGLSCFMIHIQTVAHFGMNEDFAQECLKNRLLSENKLVYVLPPKYEIFFRAAEFIQKSTKVWHHEYISQYADEYDEKLADMAYCHDADNCTKIKEVFASVAEKIQK